jgi:hypothetical protein
VQAASVDGKAVTASQKGNLIEIKLNAGEHCVHIAY